MKKKRIEKANLPTKPCAVCQRPFTWRKKWSKVWDEVLYCSDACRRGRRSVQSGNGKA
ncbi:DUF2256 domain-containing protein [Prosthecomicrobium hirschii]|uniref:DUF2256 domain-containing protein n=1 Tax=Prosthecodimorpha hirschii TaxID=665126 RepID=UPI0009F9D3B4|nr:DUF2256 domain-containing protein [Prosthecomicrobium hirschii]